MTDIKKIIEQAHTMQKQMKTNEQQAEKAEFVGNAGGGLVLITCSGKGNVKKVQIDQSLLDPSKSQILEDLIIKAFNDSKKKAEDFSKESIESSLGGFLDLENLQPFK